SSPADGPLSSEIPPKQRTPEGMERSLDSSQRIVAAGYRCNEEPSRCLPSQNDRKKSRNPPGPPSLARSPTPRRTSVRGHGGHECWSAFRNGSRDSRSEPA